ncbi:D-alanine--D-alanine ligase, partial [Candidatus Daviesbacteria bacterium]|nr:D-alanine--D-alanine ligase [Candidatus Daviesbacteria bacterium]
INSLPGSLAYYLWEKSGIKYTELLDKLINYALQRFEEQKKTQYIFNSGLLSQMAKGAGLKR